MITPPNIFRTGNRPPAGEHSRCIHKESQHFRLDTVEAPAEYHPQHAVYLVSSQSNGVTVNELAQTELVYDAGSQSAENALGGVRMDSIPKEGGNTFSGVFRALGSRGSLQSDNITAALRQFISTSRRPARSASTSVNTMDLRVAKAIRFGRRRLQVFTELFNVPNNATILTVNETVGPLYFNPQAITQGRRAQFGAQVDW